MIGGCLRAPAAVQVGSTLSCSHEAFLSTAIPYWQVAAFSSELSGGNLAAVFQLEQWLSDEVLSEIARNVDLPACAFLVADTSGEADWEICWFGPSGEIQLCGHASLAAGHILLSKGGTTKCRFRTRHSGLVEVMRAGAGYELALRPIETRPFGHPEAVEALGREPIASFRSQQGYNLFVFEDEEAIRNLSPSFPSLEKLGSDQFICSATGSETDIVSRVFKGDGEDAVTGSAHAVLAPYWCARLGKTALRAHQASKRGGDVTLRLDGDRVWIGGPCVTIAEKAAYLRG